MFSSNTQVYAANATSQQQGSISGKVTSESGEPIPGVTVVVTRHNKWNDYRF